MGGKWLGLLKEVSPQVVHVAVLYHPQTAPYAASFLEPLQAGARALSVQVHAAEINEPSDVEREAAALPLNFSSGLIIIPSIFMTAHRDLIVSVAARYRMAAIYPFRFFASAGGLIAYGSDAADIHSRAASYVDRVLKGARPGDLPVQQPIKFEFVINLKTAKSLGLDVASHAARAGDEVDRVTEGLRRATARRRACARRCICSVRLPPGGCLSDERQLLPAPDIMLRSVSAALCQKLP